jgi:hypothetical protein
MSTDARTLRFSDASSMELRRNRPGFRARSYTPGAKVVNSTLPEKRQKRSKTQNQKKLKAKSNQNFTYSALPSDVLEKILLFMVEDHALLSVVKLSMVSKRMNQEISNNLVIWYKMYLHWRGPITNQTRSISATRGGVVSLRPTIPRSLPNFRDKTPPYS